jgi:hypothetical protein
VCKDVKNTFAVSSGERAWNKECKSPSEDMNCGVRTMVSGETMSRIRRFDRSSDVVDVSLCECIIIIHVIHSAILGFLCETSVKVCNRGQRSPLILTRETVK